MAADIVSNEPATCAGALGLVEDEPVLHLRVRSAHPGQRDSDCINLLVMPFNTCNMIKTRIKELRKGLKAVRDNDIRLLHKGIELRGGYPLDYYLNTATTKESPAELQYLVSNHGAKAQNTGMYVAQQVPTPHDLLDLVDEISDAMCGGIKPSLTDDGTGATYMLRGPSSSKPLAVFKPKDEEAFAPNNPRGYAGKENSNGLRPGVLSTQQAAREVAAFLLDHKNFAGVPHTTLVHAKHEKFVNPDKSKVEWKVGAFQQFVNSCGTSGDFGMSVFSVSSVHRIGILDVRIVNLDRNDGNLLVADNKRLKLIPIDHGLSLPDRLEVYTSDVVWMDWPQAKKPFAPAELEYIRSLDAAKDAKNIETQLGVRRECLRLLEVTTKLLQFGAERGLTLYQIGLILYREDPDDGDGTHKPSVLEGIIGRCVESAFASIGQSSGTASSTVEGLDLLSSFRPEGRSIRRQVSGGGGQTHQPHFYPSPQPSPMIGPGRPPAEGMLTFTPLESGESDSFDVSRAASPGERTGISPQFDGRPMSSGEQSGSEHHHTTEAKDDSQDELTEGRGRRRDTAGRYRRSVRPSAARVAAKEGSGSDASTGIFAIPGRASFQWPVRLEKAFFRHLAVELCLYFDKHFPAAVTVTEGAAADEVQ
ncbi:PI4KG6 [Symbiodinium natans]|uniref:PI4KG6 protein n=1 Tax=Symbiodinium natans TaxID=878477 RepID=A0A812SAV1_9DINO|nr:PI4KG6 [Symbiodinium natans]